MNILAALLSWLLLYKYIALFIIVYSGSVLLPLPVNAALLAVGAFSGEHYFNFWISLVVAVVANCAGDLTAYAVTRRWGETVTHALRLNKLRFFGYLGEELRTDAAITIFLTRQAGYLSNISNFLAGLVRVPFLTFLFFDFIEIVQRRPRDQRTRDCDRSEQRDWRERACAPDLDLDIFDNGRNLRRRKFQRDHAARRFRSRAHPSLLLKRIYFHDDAVDVEG